MIVILWALNISTHLIFMQSYEVPLLEEAANGELDALPETHCWLVQNTAILL